MLRSLLRSSSLAKALHYQANGTPKVFTLEDQQTLNNTAETIISRISEQDIDYTGRKYEIWAKGKRRVHLGFKREPDILLGHDYGRSFLEACIHYFTCVMFCDRAYNPTKNTISGYVLYGLPE